MSQTKNIELTCDPETGLCKIPESLNDTYAAIEWKTDEENVVVPIIDYKKQGQIADLIEHSFSLKKQSKHLLEVVKRAVEIEIKENEAIALKYINQETK